MLDYVGASLYRDEVDERYVRETRTKTATYKGSVTNKPGLIDIVADCEGYTEANFPTGQREADFDTDKDGMSDEWEMANGLDSKNANDAKLYTLDPKGWYTNIEVYANSLVEDIMKAGNADAVSAVDEYYPALKQAVKGDVNGDGNVNGTDIQSVINLIVAEEYQKEADVNEDGKVNGTDIQAIINIIIEE